MKLDKIYINEAIRIRGEYMTSLKNILKEEGALNIKKSEIDNIQDGMEKMVESDMHDVTKRLKLNEQLIKIERIIKNIQGKIKPHYDNIENLRVDADRLYTSIKEKYPNVTENDIKEQIAPYIDFK